MSRTAHPKLVVGWREWVALPELGIAAVKPKIDTGARSSSLHALHIEQFERDGAPWLRFDVHPLQRDSATTVRAEAPLLEYRMVKSSSGHATRRPVIVTQLELAGLCWPIELTLAARDQMGFRMLLGREALRGRFNVDPGHSYLVSKPPVRLVKPKKKKKRKKKSE
ncbi:MAG: ATP-dependent zinc protease [Planctomycetaceae bacterium]|nr:ATP-dependent zinc protease [Planctomycetaceae bacterium]